MRITQSRLNEIIQEEYTRALILESPEVAQAVSEKTAEAETAASNYGLKGMDWNSIITTVVASGLSLGGKALGGPLGIAAGLSLDAAALVKAVYEAVQAARATVELERLVKEITNEWANVAMMGITFDKPLTPDAIKIISDLPQDQKDRIGTLIARIFQYQKRAFISLLNASPDDVVSGSMAGSLAVMPIEEAVISMSQLAAEIVEIIPWLDSFLRSDNFAAKALHTILNRMMLLNLGRIATAIGMLDPTSLDRLEPAPEMDFTPYVPPEMVVDDKEGEEQEEEDMQMPLPFVAESFSYSRMGLLAGIKNKTVL